MNIFHKYALESLKKNKFRTIVTIIGVMLSVSLFTAVFEGAGSGNIYLRNVTESISGRLHGIMSELTADQLEDIRNDERIDEFVFSGYAGTGTDDKNRVYCIESGDWKNNELFNISLREGRYPENENEIIIPYYFFEDDDDDIIGKHITLKMLGENTVESVTREYLVTGVFSRNSVFDKINAFTVGENCGSYTCFFTLKDPASVYEFADEQTYTDKTEINTHLMATYGAADELSISAMIYGLAFVLAVLIAVASVSLIYNSFSISVTERVRQFGILKSVGATKKQIRFVVLTEALIISLISVPAGVVVGCTGIGVTLKLMSGMFDKLAASVLSGSTGNITIRLVLNPVLIAAACVFGILTVFVSAWIPAARAARITPVEAIRKNRDVSEKKIKNKAHFYERILGFEGMMASRNFRRNRKRNRTVVFSLVISIVLFISARSFSDNLSQTVKSDYSWSKYSADIVWHTLELPENCEKTKNLLESSEYTENVMYNLNYNFQTNFHEESFTDAFKTTYDYEYIMENNKSFDIQVVFASDAAFRKLCAENGTDPEKFFDKNAPCALLHNQVRKEGGEEKRRMVMDTFRESALPFDLISEEGLMFHITDITDIPFTDDDYTAYLVYPFSMREAVCGDNDNFYTNFRIKAEDHRAAYNDIKELLKNEGIKIDSHYILYDITESMELDKMLITMLDVFTLGFIILISMIASANIINTISTNISLRRREFAMLRSVGMSEKSFNRMMNLECLIYGVRSILWSIPFSVAVTWLMYKNVSSIMSCGYIFPVKSAVISVVTVFAVVFISMLFSASKIKKENIIDILRNENI